MPWWSQPFHLSGSGLILKLIEPLEVCLAGASTMAFQVASKYHWTLVAVLRSLAAKVLISDEQATQDLTLRVGFVIDLILPRW